jgi:ADP-ribose pyrophosphatase YjhB (NUDIX family)
MIAVVCSAVIQGEEGFLLVKEFKPECKDKWGLPGGKLEENESLSSCVRREVLEETGFTVISDNLLCVVNKPVTSEKNSVVKFIFKCEIAGNPTSKAAHEYNFISIDKIKSLDSEDKLRGAEILEILESIHNNTFDKALILRTIN